VRSMLPQASRCARHVLPSVTVLTFLGLFASTPPAAAAPIAGIVAFGDSLSDAGNVFIATGGAIPGPPYVNGHFSNGPTWIEDLSQNLGLGTLKPSLSGGTDFAFGGAVTGPSVPNAVIAGIPDITQQVLVFLAHSGVASSSNLYAVWIGSNDVYAALADIQSGLSLGLATTDLQNAAQTEANALNSLAQAGAKNFIVPLVPDLGLTPAAAGAGAALATSLSTDYNSDLLADIASIVTSDGISVDILNSFGLLDKIVADPAVYGLSNVTDPCYTGSSTCSAPDSYLFWDGQHPTAAAAELFAAAAKASLLPEPSTLVLFGAGLAGLAARRGRCKARVST
jgi:phospholipase/lecithinase/hemolysin